MLAVLGLGVSFGLTVLFFGFVVLAGVLLLLIGLTLLATHRQRGTALAILGASGLALSGPLVYVCLAVLQTT